MFHSSVFMSISMSMSTYILVPLGRFGVPGQNGAAFAFLFLPTNLFAVGGNVMSFFVSASSITDAKHHKCLLKVLQVAKVKVLIVHF